MSGDGPDMFEVIGWMPIMVGLVVATISAALAVRWLVAFLTKHGLAVFGYYRLVLTAVLGGAIWMGVVTIHTGDGVHVDDAVVGGLDVLEVMP